MCDSNPFIHDNILYGINRLQSFTRGNHCLASRMSFKVTCGSSEHLLFWVGQKIYCNSELLVWWESKMKVSAMYLPHLGVWYSPQSLPDSHFQGKIIFFSYMCCGHDLHSEQ